MNGPCSWRESRNLASRWNDSAHPIVNALPISFTSDPNSGASKSNNNWRKMSWRSQFFSNLVSINEILDDLLIPDINRVRHQTISEFLSRSFRMYQGEAYWDRHWVRYQDHYGLLQKPHPHRIPSRIASCISQKIYPPHFDLPVFRASGHCGLHQSLPAIRTFLESEWIWNQLPDYCTQT